MSSKRIAGKTMLYERKDLTVGDFKRAINEKDIIKISKITSFEINSCSKGKVVVETENGENLELRVGFIIENSGDEKYRVGFVYIPNNNTQKFFTIVRKYNSKKDRWIFKAVYSGVDIYKDQTLVGYLNIFNDVIFACRLFEDNTGIQIYIGKWPYSIGPLCGLSRVKSEIKDYSELGEYFSSINLPINVQEIFERFKQIIEPELFAYVMIKHFESTSMGLKNEEILLQSSFRRWINYIDVEDGILDAYTIVDGKEAFSVIKDSDFWYYSNGSVRISKLRIDDSKPYVSNITITFKDEETALEEIENIDLNHIFTRIAELQKQLE